MKKNISYTVFTLMFFLASLPSVSFSQEHHNNLENDKHSQSIVKIMQDMNNNLANISKAIMLEDYDKIALSAHKIAFHPPIKKEDIEKLFKRLGDKKEAFIACDKAVHNMALQISAAGKNKDMVNILKYHSDMIAKATECHKNFR